MNLNIKLKEGAKMPTKAHANDAGFDLYCDSISWDNGRMICGTGVHAQIPEGFVGLVTPRSSIRSTAHMMANSVGVIDAGYIGEISVTFRVSGTGRMYEIGERVAQLLVIEIPEVSLTQVENLEQTERGEGGHGSSGK